MRRPPWDGWLLALDLATVTGVCMGLTTCKRPHTSTIRLPSGGSDAAAALALERHLVPLIEPMVRDYPVEIAIEEPPPAISFSGRTNARTISRLRTLATKADEISIALTKREVLTVPAPTWRKALTGIARFGKVKPYPAIVALNEIGWDVTDHNAADAGGVWLYTLGLKNPDERVRFDPLVYRSRARKERATA